MKTQKFGRSPGSEEGGGSFPPGRKGDELEGREHQSSQHHLKDERGTRLKEKNLFPPVDGRGGYSTSISQRLAVGKGVHVSSRLRTVKGKKGPSW